MKKSFNLQTKSHNINVITNGKDEFDNIVICFHGFGGDKWGDTYSGLKKRLDNSLVASFDSCGHGESEVSLEDMRLDVILEEIKTVVNYFKEFNKPIILVSNSYGGYRVIEYLIKYKPDISKVIYVNPAFNILKTLESVKDFQYTQLKENDKVVVNKSLNKFIKKPFLDDLYNNNLYKQKYDIDYDTDIIVGTKDSLIPIDDTLKISNMYGYKIIYVEDEHIFENKDNYQLVADIIKEIK